MHAVCPSCSAFVDVDAGQLTSCPQCGHWWIVEGETAPTQAISAEAAAAGALDEGGAGSPWEFELQHADGDLWQGPYDRFSLRELLYVGRLTGDENIRVPGTTDIERLGERPEFVEVLQLIGKAESTQTHRSSIAGWKKSGGTSEPEAEKAPPAPAAAAPPPSAEAPAPAPAPDAPAPASAPAADSGGSLGGAAPALIAGGIVLAIAVGAALALFALG